MDNREFEIEYGILLRYRGDGGKVVIPDTVTVIGEVAFAECRGLRRVVIPESVTDIGVKAFFNCVDLREVVISRGVKVIKDESFSGCESLENIELPDTVTSIGACAFYNCKAITRVEIPNSVTELGRNAFSGCTALRNVTLSESLKTLESHLFSFCENLTEVVIPDSVDKIESVVFYGCKRLRSVVIPNSVTSIGINTFRECYSLERLVVPESVVEIGYDTFFGIGEVDFSYGNADICNAVLDVSIKNDRLPKSIGVPVDCYEGVDNRLKLMALRGFHNQWRRGELSEDELSRVAGFLQKRLVRTLGEVGDDPSFYSFAADIGAITKANAKKLLEKTESLECRAILLEYARRFSAKV